MVDGVNSFSSICSSGRESCSFPAALARRARSRRDVPPSRPAYDGRMRSIVTARRRSGEGRGGDELDRRLQRGLMLAPAGANVVLQMSRRGVGRGVAESRVSRGSLVRHPLRRTRTTLTYIWVSLYGTDDERRELRRNVDAQHRHVRSRPRDDVAYDAFDADLQLWVAACMYVGSLQGYETLYGPISPETAETFLARCSRFATTLQVPSRTWPGDRAAFERYWMAALEDVRMDEVTRKYLQDFVDLRFLAAPWRHLLGPLHRLLTLGYLPEEIRATLGATWEPRQQQRFERVGAIMRWLNVVLPVSLAAFPWNLVREDARRRFSRRRPLF